MLGALPALLLFIFAELSRAQNSTSGPPTCTDSALNWSFNSAGVSPCAITVALGGACVGGRFDLPPVTPGFVYLAPNSTNATPCRCSSVYYSTLSACSACQGADFLTWSIYKAACPVVYLQTFPQPIPPDVKVPHWAYLDVSQGDNFSLAAAQSAGDGPESTAIASPTQSSSPSDSTTSQTNPSSSKGVNAGAIAGGVIGGVAFLALVAGLVFWILRRQRLAKASHSPGHGNMSYAPSTFASTSIPAKHYDPNDPSTFPTNDMSDYNTLAPTPPPGGPHSLAPNLTGTTHQTTFTAARPHYTGAPEL